MLVNLFSMGLSFGMFLAIFLSYLIVLLFSFSVHEFSHAFAAYKHGDYTAKYLGRMTLNPFAHFNASGFICLILFGFGWANPVPVNPYNYKNGKKSMFAVAFGGILANLILVTIFTFAYTLIYTLCPQLNPVNITYVNSFWSEFLWFFLQFGITINISLAVFNLLPLYPLDGYQILELILKPNSKTINFLKQYSTLILLAFLLFGVGSALISLVTDFLGLVYVKNLRKKKNGRKNC